MKIEKNVGTIDALVRITAGLTGLAWATAKMARRRGGTGAGIVALLSAMKVAEGTTRFCPMLAYFGTNSLSDSDNLAGNERQGQGKRNIRALGNDGNGGARKRGETGEGSQGFAGGTRARYRIGEGRHRSIRASLRRPENRRERAFPDSSGDTKTGFGAQGRDDALRRAGGEEHDRSV